MAISRESLAKRIGSRIRDQRDSLDLTQGRLAELVGLDTTYLSQIERGIRLPSLDALVRIAEKLHVNPGFLIDPGKTAKDDPLLNEVRDVLAKWKPKQRKAILKALRTLSDL